MSVSADTKHACPFPFVVHADTVTHPGTVTPATLILPFFLTLSPLLLIYLMEVHAENRGQNTRNVAYSVVAVESVVCAHYPT